MPSSACEEVPTTAANTVTDTATISDPNIAVTGGFAFRAAQNCPASISGTLPTLPSFPTRRSSDLYTATINWGDGTTSAGTIVTSDGVATGVVTGSHTYSGDNIEVRRENV